MWWEPGMVHVVGASLGMVHVVGARDGACGGS